MVYFDRIDVSEAIDLKKANASKERLLVIIDIS